MRIPARLGRAALSPCIRRTFSSTAVRPATIPQFVPSSSPELDSQFESVRDRIIIPKHLTPRQLKIVYNEKNRHLFDDPENPVEAHIGGTTVQLQPLDHTERLDTWLRVKSIVSQARTPDDWVNVEQLLGSMVKAGIKLRDYQREMLVRKAFFQGHREAVMRMLERADETGLRIEQERALTFLLWGFREIAVSGRWSRNSIDRALTGTRQVADLLEKPEHGGGKRTARPGDLRTLPLTIAAPLELLAVALVLYPRSPFHQTKALEEVRQGAERLLNNMKIYKSPISVVEPQSVIGAKWHEGRFEHLMLAKARLFHAVPVRHALALAQRLLGPSDQMPQPAYAAQVLAKCDKVIAESVDKIGQNLRPGQSLEANPAVRGVRACDWVDEIWEEKKKREERERHERWLKKQEEKLKREKERLAKKKKEWGWGRDVEEEEDVGRETEEEKEEVVVGRETEEEEKKEVVVEVEEQEKKQEEEKQQ
ncbi:hypothetical protein BKA81DRAFT_351709 [Phyllosticta paracitricarpa]|uniref:Uncharacterized protein n=1 Tax=Phyllosticta paracitricarpa TaxID=2016321 RepID=A0ABR1N6D8_9PEZI